MRHLAARHSIAVVTVPARGTSRYCPRCGQGTSVLMHCSAPDRVGERGWRWASCPACGLSCDRDWAAAERILARGLLGQTPPVPTAPPARAPSTPSWRATWPAPDHDANSPARLAAPAAPEPTCIPDRRHATGPRTAPPRNGPPASRPTHETTLKTARETTRWLSAVCPTGARCPPHRPPAVDSVRRAMHPSRDGVSRTGQGMSGILTIGPASTTPKPPPCSRLPSTGAVQGRLRLSELPDSFREPQGIQDANTATSMDAPDPALRTPLW
ncbi:zinc ribbon domain-containing protein [Nonomuraea sp. NPDC049750]|uniref:zinc ribbon domain-containing protein n=1 Tax=Nonomuraea sp. NPDC049750 TaxID=3154738 RepID=UPI0033F28870